MKIRIKANNAGTKSQSIVVCFNTKVKEFNGLEDAFKYGYDNYVDDTEESLMTYANSFIKAVCCMDFEDDEVLSILINLITFF